MEVIMLFSQSRRTPDPTPPSSAHCKELGLDYVDVAACTQVTEVNHTRGRAHIADFVTDRPRQQQGFCNPITDEP